MDVGVKKQSSSIRSMPKTLERYEKSNYGAHKPHVSAQQSLELSCQLEYLKLKACYEALMWTQRNLLGEDLGPLSLHKIESLERQLASSLKLIRSTREHMLNEANQGLRLRLLEGYQADGLQLYPAVAEELGFGQPPCHQTSHDVFFHPLDSRPTLNIW